MLLIGVDVSGDLVGVGTLLVGIGTLLTSLDNRRRAGKLEKGQEAIHKTVNGVATAERARTDRAEAALSDAGLPLPPIPIVEPE